MLTKTQNRRLQQILKRFDSIDAAFIREVAERIAEMRDMEAINLALLFALINQRSVAIEGELNTAIRQSAPEIKQLYGEALSDVYKSKRFAGALKANPLPKDVRETLDEYAVSTGRQTADLMRERVLGNRISTVYQKAVNDAFLVATSGLKDYHGLTRTALKELATKGIRAGDGWRMSNAIKRAILDGVQDIQQKANDILCVALGYDAREISVHVNSAPDHEPVQGRVFLNGEFEKLQSGQSCVDIDGRFYPGMDRPIGALNCRHLVYGFSTKRSIRRYSQEQLDAMMRRNADGCEINGKHYTLYQAKQYLGRLEAAERRQIDIARAADAAGDKQLLMDCANTLQGVRQAKKIVSDVIEKAEKAPGDDLTSSKKCGKIGIEIDEKTPCLRRAETGELVDTTIRKISPTKAACKGWEFDWTAPGRKGYDVYALRIKGDRAIQGMIALKDEPHNYAIHVDIVESAPWNNTHNALNTNNTKLYVGVGGHLFAEACKQSIDKGYGGYVYFTAKTNLIAHYEEMLGAELINARERIMIINGEAALRLVQRYFGGDE